MLKNCTFNVLLFAIVIIVRLLHNVFCHFALVTAMGQKKQVVLTLFNNHSQPTVSWYLLKVLKGLEAFCLWKVYIARCDHEWQSPSHRLVYCCASGFGQTFKTNLQIKKTWLNVIVGITKQSSVVCSPCRCCGPR